MFLNSLGEGVEGDLSDFRTPAQNGCIESFSLGVASQPSFLWLAGVAQVLEQNSVFKRPHGVFAASTVHATYGNETLCYCVQHLDKVEKFFLVKQATGGNS